MASEDEQRPRFEPQQEVRFAVVMYGGVSLAVYINGVAQELFRLVQATAPRAAPDAGDEGLRVHHRATGDGDVLTPSARIYRSLGQRLHAGGFDGPVAAGAPVRTRFVVDILSGTSAGGINGVLLAKSLANRSDFVAPSKRIWLDVADVGKLLEWRPLKRSLLSGDLLYREARTALRDLAGDEGRRSPGGPIYVEQLDLAVTATDLRGLAAPVELQLGTADESQHRTVFEFSFGSVATSGEQHSQFTPDHDRMLAFVARATSSFPVAFAPVSHRSLPACDERTRQEGPERWLREHRRGRRAPDEVFFADGGYLDNKPFTYATRALRRRRADLPVRRLLLYVEPDPAGIEKPAAGAPARPGPVATMLAGFTLPRAEPIGQDVIDVTERNEKIERLREAERAAIDAPPGSVALGVASYRGLRLAMTFDRLAEVAVELAGLEADGSERRAVAKALRQWAAGSDSTETLLGRLDVAVQRRRLSTLNDRISGWLREADVTAAEAGELRRLKRALNDAFEPLRVAQRAPFALCLEPLLERAGLRAEFDAVVAAAVAVVREPGEAAAGDYADTVAKFLSGPMRCTDDGIARALAEGARPAAAVSRLRALDARFEQIDMVALPLAYPDLGELNAVEVHRVSPLEASALRIGATGKLGGVRLAHFGAFLSRRYRWNDLLWGRLDGAEAIVAALLPGDARAGALLVQLHAAIVRETIAEPSRESRRLRRRIGRRLPCRIAWRLWWADAAAATDAELLAAFRRAWTPPGPLNLVQKAWLAVRLLPVLARLIAIELVVGAAQLLRWAARTPRRLWDALLRRFGRPRPARS